MQNYLKLILVVCSIMLHACGGIEPPPPELETAIDGKITFVGTWPVQDSSQDVRFVAFDEIPRDSSAIPVSVLEQKAIFSQSIPYDSDTASFHVILKNEPRLFKYVCIAQQFGPDPFSDWRVLSVYSTDEQKTPLTLDIIPSTTTTLSFIVDFSNIPPQPFE